MALFLRVLTFRSKLKEQNRSTDDCIKLTFPKGSHKLLKPHPFTVLSLALFNITTFSLFRHVPYFVHLVHSSTSLYICCPIAHRISALCVICLPVSLVIFVYLFICQTAPG